MNSRRDFLPFGEELTANQTSQRNAGVGYATDSVRQKFTGYERDGETDLDFAQARMYASNLGRFTTTDPASFRKEDTQEFNRYVYVANNPLRFIDPSGETLVITGDDANSILENLQRLSGLTLRRDEKTGVVTVDPDNDRNTKGTSKSLADLVEKVTAATAEVDGKEKEFTVELIAVKNSSDFFIDNFQTNEVDVQDLNDISDVKNPEGESDNGAFLAGQLGHILEERLVAETSLSSIPGGRGATSTLFRLAHGVANAAESSIISDFSGTREQSRTGENIGTAAAYVYTSTQYTVLFESQSQNVKAIVRKPVPK